MNRPYGLAVSTTKVRTDEAVTAHYTTKISPKTQKINTLVLVRLRKYAKIKEKVKIRR